MRIETFVVVDIAESELVQLGSISATRGIHREEDWPRKTRPNHTDQDNEFEEAEEQIAIQ